MHKQSGARRLINAFINAKHGLISAWNSEEAFRQEIFIGIISFPLLLFIDISLERKILLLMLFLILLVVELLNSAIETLSDKITTSYDPLIKKTKDIASAAVFITILINLIAWFFCFIA